MLMRRNTFFENQEPGTGWASGSFKESKASLLLALLTSILIASFSGSGASSNHAISVRPTSINFRKSTDKYNTAERDHGYQFWFPHSGDRALSL
jgi:hypothetical protein